MRKPTSPAELLGARREVINTIWEVEECGTGVYSRARLDSLLAAGWEPYAASSTGVGTIIHLRRRSFK